MKKNPIFIVILFFSLFSFSQHSSNQENPSVDQDFVLNINYSKSVLELILLNQLDWHDSQINDENFIIEIDSLCILDSNQIILRLFYFGLLSSSEKNIAAIYEAGYRPANIVELLFFGANYPDIQNVFSIIALGSFCKGQRYGRGVPVLGVNGKRRELFLSWFDQYWGSKDLFLAVKISPP